ncbi:hypothetical protein KBD45_05140 [Candidatus Dojkabacteria bacterium]|nr:hypothetical protein [Candidatus Dojkabacteria bacterium]
MNKKNKSRLVLLISAYISIVSFVMTGFIGGGMLPYQDPSPELLKKYNDYLQTYTPILNILMIIFFISTVVFMINSIQLIIKLFRKSKNNSNIT